MEQGHLQQVLEAPDHLSFIQASPVALNVLSWAGAAYLIRLGIKLLLQSRKFAYVTRPPVTASRALREGIISNLTSPKERLFMLAFLPQFVNPNGTLPAAECPLNLRLYVGIACSI